MPVPEEEMAAPSQGKMLLAHSVLLLLLISPSPVLVDYSMQITLPNGNTFASVSTEVAIHTVDDKFSLARSFNKCGSAQTPCYSLQYTKCSHLLKQHPLDSWAVSRPNSLNIQSLFKKRKEKKGAACCVSYHLCLSTLIICRYQCTLWST